MTTIATSPAEPPPVGQPEPVPPGERTDTLEVLRGFALLVNVELMRESGLLDHLGTTSVGLPRSDQRLVPQWPDDH